MKSDRQVLEEAIELLDNPEHWIQGDFARDDEGAEIDPMSPDAASWCAVGALIRAGNFQPCNLDSGQQARRILLAVLPSEEERVVNSLIEFNDSVSHQDLILALKRGLDNLEGEDIGDAVGSRLAG